MATVGETYTNALPDDWAPGRPYRLSVAQYEAMVERGVLKERDRVFLLNGRLLEKMTNNPPHAVSDGLTGDELGKRAPDGWHVRASLPLRLAEQSSMPEPDQAVVRGARRDYEGRHPGPEDVALVVEVSDSSFADDRAMAAVYGRAGVPVYWIVNIGDRRVEVFTRPGPEGYSHCTHFDEGAAVPLEIDGAVVGQIAVADVLPRPKS